jgi:glycerol-3-phosphate acyltransferase PlsY
LILDVLKGAAAVLLVGWLWPGAQALGAVGAFVGHLYPLWLKFRGGKGVATYLGIALALYWPAGLFYAGLWILILLLTRFSSLAGMSAALLTPVYAAVVGRFDLALLFLAFGLLACWKHRSNVERLLAGTEPRVGRAGDG